MATIVFYEKPGCINGEKQKAILTRAGHTLDCRNILTHPWSRKELVSFFGEAPPSVIMNSTAPAIKSGELDPAKLSFDEAVALMIDSPILIQRPLIQVEGISIQGFADRRLKPYLGDWDSSEDVVTCPNLLSISCDDKA